MREQVIKTDAAFWEERWKEQQTGWDLQSVSPPLKSYIDTITDKHLSILIPGCGNAYEAAYLLDKGFKQITLIDIAPTLVAQLLQKFAPHVGKELTLICGDFFQHTGQYDIILEQTFFCALDPKLRPAYEHHMHMLLKPQGTLAGLLFNKSFEGGPPFGGNKEEYLDLFQDTFEIKKMEPCTDSVQPRAGAELFIELSPK